jgi:hypothetical protein
MPRHRSGPLPFPPDGIKGTLRGRHRFSCLRSGLPRPSFIIFFIFIIIIIIIIIIIMSQMRSVLCEVSQAGIISNRRGSRDGTPYSWWVGGHLLFHGELTNELVVI